MEEVKKEAICPINNWIHPKLKRCEYTDCQTIYKNKNTCEKTLNPNTDFSSQYQRTNHVPPKNLDNSEGYQLPEDNKMKTEKDAAPYHCNSHQ